MRAESHQTKPCAAAVSRISRRPSLGRTRTHLGPLEQLLLSGGHVLVLAAPGLQHGGLQGAAEAERQRPRLLAGEGVDGVEVDGGLLLGLSAGEEGDARHGGRHGALQRRHRGARHLLRRELLGARLAGRHHVGLEQGALQEDVVVVERLVDEGQHGLGDLLGAVQVVVAVGQHLGLDDRHQAVHLAH